MAALVDVWVELAVVVAGWMYWRRVA